MQNTRENGNRASESRRRKGGMVIEESSYNSDPKFISFLKSLNWRRIILVVTAVYAFLSISLRSISILQQKAKQKELLAEKAAIEQQIQDLEDEKEYVGSDEYIERVAREKLGWAKDNEIVFKKGEE